MLGDKITWSLIGLLNSLPLLAGATLQIFQILKDVKKTLLASSGFLILFLIITLGVIVDNETATPSDVNDAYIIGLLIGIFFFAFLAPKKTIIPLNGMITLVYNLTSWILFLPYFISEGPSKLDIYLFIIPTGLATLFSLLLTLKKRFRFRSLLEILSYTWVVIFLAIVSIFIYITEIKSAFPENKLNLIQSNADWIQIFLSGTIFFYTGTVILSFVMMLPIFKGEDEPYEIELKRAKEHRKKVITLFQNDTFTITKAFIFLLLIGVLTSLKYFLNLSNIAIIYIATAGSGFLLENQKSQE